MRFIRGKKNGQITVFLSLILLCICSLVFGLLESARLAGARWYWQSAAGSALDSLFSNYHENLWDEYQIFGIETNASEDLVFYQEQYLKKYQESARWYGMEVEEIEIEPVYLTDGGGIYFEEEVADYMVFGVWDSIFGEESQEQTKRLQEGEAINQVSSIYSKQIREALQLEAVLEDLILSIGRQQEAYEQAVDGLNSQVVFDLLSALRKLDRENNKMITLGKDYIKKAGLLKKKLDEMKRETEPFKESLGEEARAIVEEEENQLYSYVEINGLRMEEIQTAIKKAQSNLVVIKDCKKEIAFQQQEEESDESENEGGGVSAVFDSYQMIETHLSVSSGDPQKKQLLENIMGMVESGVLPLVLPDGVGVSQTVIDTKELPSIQGSTQREGGENLISKMQMIEYCYQFTSNFKTQNEGPLSYELEYVLNGEASDEENLKATVNQLVMLRQGMNFIHILSDSQKRSEANTLAGVIMGSTGLVPLTFVLSFFIMTVWAFGEAICDVKSLLAGEKVPLLKSNSDWNLSLMGLLEIGKNQEVPFNKEKERGFSYEEYLRWLLVLKSSTDIAYRMMDVIQLNIQGFEQGFQMVDCVFSVRSVIRGTGRYFFSSFGDGSYSVKVEAYRGY